MSFLENAADGDYSVHLKKQLEPTSLSLNALSLTIIKHLGALEGFVKRQNLLAEDDLDAKLLTRAFRRFPNFHSLHIDPSPMHIAWHEIHRNLGSFVGRILSLKGSHTFETLSTALDNAHIDLATLRLSNAENDVNTDPGSTSSPTPLDSYMPVEYGDWDLDIAFLSKRLSHPKAFRNIRALEIAGSTDVNQKTSDLSAFMNTFTAISPKPDVLKIEAAAWLINPRLRTLFLSNTRKGSLRCLELECAHGSVSDIVLVLRIFSETLERVRIRGVEVAGEGTWSEVLKELRAVARFPVVRFFHLFVTDGKELEVWA